MREVRHWLCPYVSTGNMSKIYVNEASREAKKEMEKFGGRAQEAIGWMATFSFKLIHTERKAK